MSTAELVAQIILSLVAIYLAIGIVVAIHAHSRLSKVDPAAKGGGFFFRLLVTPGMVGLWPLVLRRLRAKEPPGTEQFTSARKLRTRHRLSIQLVAVIAPVAIAVALLVRPNPAINATILPERLQQPAPLAMVIRKIDAPFPGHAIAISIRANEDGSERQAEITVSEALTAKKPILYFVPASSNDGTVVAAMYLGPIDGEGTRRFAIPSGTGTFTIIDATDGTEI